MPLRAVMSSKETGVCGVSGRTAVAKENRSTQIREHGPIFGLCINV
jgi:hypothetical protein